jgi:hypothetical protein
MKIGDRHPNLNLLVVNAVDKNGNPLSWRSVGPTFTQDHPDYSRLARQFELRRLTRIGDDFRTQDTE